MADRSTCPPATPNAASSNAMTVGATCASSRSTTLTDFNVEIGACLPSILAPIPDDPPGVSPSGRVTLLKPDDRPKSRNLGVGITNACPTRMPNKRIDRLHDPTGNDLRRIAEFEIGFVVARRRKKCTEIDLVLIETANTV